MAVLNVQTGFNTDFNHGRQVTVSSCLRGEPLTCDMYIKRIDMNAIDCASEKTISKFLIDLYRGKDQLADHYNKFGAFPGEMVITKSKLLPLFNWFVWTSILINITTSVVIKIIAGGHYWTLGIMILVLITVIKLVDVMSRQAKVESVSSYGKQVRFRKVPETDQNNNDQNKNNGTFCTKL